MEESFGVLIPKGVVKDKDGNAIPAGQPYEAYGYNFTGMPYSMDSRKVSICIPSWEREEMLFDSFSQVYEINEISEVVIVDDCSSLELYNRIADRCNKLHDRLPKIKLYRNIQNLQCYHNKMTAISHSSNPFCIVFDSDNVMDKSYIDRLFEIPEWDIDTVYCPTFAKVNFDYRAFSGITVDKSNVGKYLDEPMFLTALNTFNCFIHRDSYLEVFDGSIDPIVNDSIYFMYCWLNSGRKIHFTEGLEYIHTVHPQSHYQNNVARTDPQMAIDIYNKLKQLR